MSANLIVNSNDRNREVPCGALVTIGRVPPNDITFPEDLKVSRNHALVRIMGDGKYYLIDLGSSNGTSVNGKRVMVPYELKDSDSIKIGDSILTFKCRGKANGETEDEAGRPVQSTLLTVGAAVQRMTILVIDIRNFTRLNEQLPPEMLAKIMGRFFRDSTQNVEHNGGVVDKFIGDAIMARWVVDAGGVKSCVKSVLSAVLGIWRVVQQLNADFPDLANSFRIGSGINTGQAVLGNVGAGGTREYTAIGDSVNIAFRLETASKELGKDVVIGQSSYDALPRNLWQNGLLSVSVKNKKKPLSVWAIKFEDLETVIKGI